MQVKVVQSPFSALAVFIVSLYAKSTKNKSTGSHGYLLILTPQKIHAKYEMSDNLNDEFVLY